MSLETNVGLLSERARSVAPLPNVARRHRPWIIGVDDKVLDAEIRHVCLPELDNEVITVHMPPQFGAVNCNRSLERLCPAALRAQLASLMRNLVQQWRRASGRLAL